MEPLASAVDRIKGFAKSSQDFVVDLLHRRADSTRRNPIEILKRLQQEAFSDLMKLRDRQDNVERVLSFHKTSKGSPFQEVSTNVMGEVDVLGAALMVSDIDRQHFDALDRAGLKSGIRLRFTFEKTVRQKDALVAEFVASHRGTAHGVDISETALSLSKVLYLAHIADWFSAIAIPIGAQFRDLGIMENSCEKRKGLTDHSTDGPSLLKKHNGSVIGLTVRKSNVTASVAHSFSVRSMQLYDDGVAHCLGTFGQIVCQFSGRTKLSLFGHHLVTKSINPYVSFAALTFPVGFLKHHRDPETSIKPLAGVSHVPMATDSHPIVSTGSIALKLETGLEENTRIAGWIEIEDLNNKRVQWAVNVFDDSEDEFGWGTSVSGTMEGPSSWSRVQAESYIKLNLGKKFNLKPGIAYVVDGNARILGLTLRSSWSF